MRLVIVVVVLAFSQSRGWAEEPPTSRPLIHVSFKRLVPKSYPIIRPRFNRLRPTTYPVIRPGVPQSGITNNLTDSFAQPLLLTSPVSRPLAPAKTRHAVSQSATGWR